MNVKPSVQQRVMHRGFLVGFVFFLSHGAALALDPLHPPHQPFEFNRQAIEPLIRATEQTTLRASGAGKGGLQVPASVPSAPAALKAFGTGQQIIVIDIPGIKTQGAERPAQWGPVLTGSTDFARHNLRHQGALGFNLQKPESGKTTTLPQRWDNQHASTLLAPVLADFKAGKNTYVKIDQNILAATYLTTGKPGEGKWVRSVGDWLADQAKQINPNARVVLNAHSKGALDAHGMELSRFSHVFLASDRGSAADVRRLTTHYRATQFIVIDGDRDFAHGLQGFMKLREPNLTVLNLKSGGLLPTTVHGQVTDPTLRGVFDIKTFQGTQRLEGMLGSIIAKQWGTGTNFESFKNFSLGDPAAGLGMGGNVRPGFMTFPGLGVDFQKQLSTNALVGLNFGTLLRSNTEILGLGRGGVTGFDFNQFNRSHFRQFQSPGWSGFGSKW